MRKLRLREGGLFAEASLEQRSQAFFTGADPSGDPGSTSRVTLVSLLNFSDLLIPPHLKNGGKNTSQD